MARNSQKDTIHLIRECLASHQDYWDRMREEMRRYKNVYEVRFFKNTKHLFDNQIRVEVADAHVFVEQYIGSLFSRNPSIECESIDADPGKREIIKTVVNRFLQTKRRPLEDASRFALIYPMAFLKLSPCESSDPLEQVAVRSIEPWDVILDRDSDDWSDQRFVGHVYYLSLPDAIEKFGNKDFRPQAKEDYFDKKLPAKQSRAKTLPDEYLYVQVVEFYDLVYDKLSFWSPNYSNGDKLLEHTDIPVRTYDGKPFPAIVPFYYARIPDRPLDGFSSLSRIYDQVYEKNIIRTFQANALRRDSRQYLTKRGAIDEESLAKITAGVDGAMIPVDAESLEGLIKEVPVTPLASNFERYLQAVENDLQRGSVLPSFTRGEATNATATEVTALAQYSSSEIGKFARERDASIELLSNLYVRMLSVLVDQNQKLVVMVDQEPKILSPEVLDLKYRFIAADNAETPISKEIKKNQFVQIIPLMLQLGTDPKAIRAELVKKFDLPESLLEDAPPPPEQQMAPQGMPQGEPIQEEL